MRVDQIWRYPVKSIGGEPLSTVAIRAEGVEGDRTLAVHNGNGEVTWAGAIPDLMRIRASRTNGGVELAMPDGTRVDCDAPEAGMRLSAAINAPVTLAPHRASDPATALHVLTTTSLETLSRALPDSAVDVTRFRPNLLLSGAETGAGGGCPEVTWVGRRMAIGGVRLRFSALCDRCVVITKETPSVPHDRAVLRWVARAFGNAFGVYASVELPGQIRVGDQARWLD